MAAASLSFNVASWDDDTNMFCWKGINTRGLIIAGSVYIWIMPGGGLILPFFDQTFEYFDGDYVKTTTEYRLDIHRPANAQQAMFQTLKWPAIVCDTLDDHIKLFSHEAEFASEPSTFSFRYLKGKPLDLKKHFDHKFTQQKIKPPDGIAKLMRDTLNNFKGFIYEENTDDVLFWIIQNPESLLEELNEVKRIVAQHKVIYHC